jgi:tetratricopeptide (TPR) repeat protein
MRTSRGIGVLLACAALAAAASGCGGPSVAQTASQSLAAGIAAQSAGDYSSATADYNKVLASQPENADALFDLGDVEQFQNQDAAAETHYQAALAVDPNFVAAMYNLATLVWRSSPVEAETLYEQVIRLDPKDADAHFNLGFVLLSLGKKTEGRTQIIDGVALDPSLKSRVPASFSLSKTKRPTTKTGKNSSTTSTTTATDQSQ